MKNNYCDISASCEIVNKLKAEKEKLKKYINHLHNLCGNETDKQYEYKQTLTEIKEMAEDFCGDCKDNSDLHKLGDCKHCTYSRILNKISEVENEHK